MNQFNPPSNPLSQQEPLFPGFPTLDVAGIFKALKNRFWLIVGIFGVFVSAAIVYVLVAPKTYESTAVVEVKTKKSAILDREQSFEAAKIDLDRLKSLAANMTNRAAVVHVIDALGLRDDPDFLKPVEGGYSDSELAEIMWKRVKSELVRGTRLITVSVKDSDPVRAQQLAQAFVDEANLASLRVGVTDSDVTRKMLESELVNQKARVDKAENAVQSLREKYPSLRLDENGGMVGTELAEATKLYSLAKNERLQAEAEMQELETIGEKDPERILNIGDYIKQEHIAKLLLDRNFKRSEFKKIQSQFEPAHPTYIAYLSDIQGLDEAIAQQGLDVARSIRQRVETTKNHEKNIQLSLDKTKKQMLELDSVVKEFRALQRAADAAYEVYAKLLARMNEADAGAGLGDQELILTDPPAVPSKPIAPKKKVTVIIAGVLGGLLGLGIILISQLLDRSLRTRRQTETTLGLTVMAEIPQAFDEDWDLRESLFVTNNPVSLVSEGFRALRTSLSTLSPRSLMLTSATPDDGKSFCAANLALLQAQFGYRTLLIDADFRRPSLAKALLDPAMGKPGPGSITARNVCKQTPYPNLSLITCSQFSPGGNETMSGEHFAAMLWEAYRSFDCVIIDTSPVGIVSDALNYARYADAVMCVIRSGETQTGDAQRMVQQLRRMRAPLAGCILNGVKETSSAQAEYYGDYQAPSRPPVHALGTSPTPANT